MSLITELEKMATTLIKIVRTEIDFLVDAKNSTLADKISHQLKLTLKLFSNN